MVWRRREGGIARARYPDGQMAGRKICVFCSSSDAVSPPFFDAARELGLGIGERGHGLVYGGANVGLMRAVADAAQEGGAHVTGVIPEHIHNAGLAHHTVDELIVTGDLRDRKRTMEQHADAFIAMPGGFGTLEELLEIITLRQLRLHEKPVILLNVADFWQPLLDLFEKLYQANFTKSAYRAAYSVAGTPAEALALAETDPADALPSKWY